jgi:hypothetical protein
MTRKQELDRALAEEARRIAEQSQGVVRKEVSPSMAFTIGSGSTVKSNIDPLILQMLQDMGLTSKDNK